MVCRLSKLHFVALDAIILDREGILAFVMTGSARFAAFHVHHGGLCLSGFIREDFGVAISAFVCLQVELVAERCFAGICFKSDFTRFQAFVAFIAIAGRGKHIFAVMTGAAGLAGSHICHGCFSDNRLVREQFGMAFFAAVRLGMNGMAECCRSGAFQGESDVFRFQSFVATITGPGNCESAFAIMA